MPSNKCCVLGCESGISVKKHVFPTEDNEFATWVSRTGNAKLEALSKSDVRKTYLICTKHFNSSNYSCGTSRLKKGSLPTVSLPSIISPKTPLDGPEHPFVNESIEFVDVSSSSPLDLPTNDSPLAIISPKTLLDGPEHPFVYESIEFVDVSSSSPLDLPTNDSPLESCTMQINKLSTTKKTKLLTSIGIKRKADLTPRKAKLYTVAKKLIKKVNLMSKKNLSFKQQLKYAKKFVTSDSCNNLSEKLNNTTLNFIKTQVNIQTKRPKGRRYTLDDKILSLSLYKTSPKGYRFLSSIFALPSRSTLNSMLNRIPFKPGVNPHIEENLKFQATKLQNSNKKCILIFDEMFLSAGLKYDKKHDMVFGLQKTEPNTTQQPKFSNHVLVFMLRGIVKKWKQPYAYYFCNSTTKTSDLVSYLKTVITSVNKTGLDIVATVCDQGGPNRAAINFLMTETLNRYAVLNKEKTNLGFEIEGKEIVPIYDPPHLLKGIRNNLFTKNVMFTLGDTTYTASWDHIVAVYEHDKQNEEFELRTLVKLNDNHINIERSKMKVSNAAQVLSHKVASIMKLVSDSAPKHSVLANAVGTAKFCLFMDKTFDSVNARTINAELGKPLRSAVRDGSPHVDHWKYAIKVFESMKFINKTNGWKNGRRNINWL